jgi:sulfur carrier protein
MTVVVNGKPTEIPEGETLLALIRRLEVPQNGVAIALNLQVVPRTEHSLTKLKPGDRVELVRAVGGG